MLADAENHGAIGIPDIPFGALEVIAAGALLQLIFGINLAILRSSAFWTPAAMRDAVLYCEFQGRAISPCLAPGNDLKAHDIHA